MKTVIAGNGVRIAAGLAVAAAALLGGGCDNNHQLGAVGGGRGSEEGGTPPGMDAGIGGSQSWTGYIENYQFRSGSDAVRFAFATDATGAVTGTVILGNGTPPPPATDPNVGYPPGYGAQNGGPTQIGGPTYVAEGYVYTMRNATLDGARLRFGVALRELWHDWCALQTPIPGSSNCLPNWGGMSSPNGCAQTNPTTGEVVPVDCGKFALCFGISDVCLCDASACKANDSNPDIGFDVSIVNDRADGSVAGYANNNVHFTKDP
jgi:hypothetical protein